MKGRSWLSTASPYLNVILIVALAAGYGYFRFQRIWWEMNATSWATYAGALQSAADHKNGHVRYYRMVMSSSASRSEPKIEFTGEYENGVEIWSWPWYSSLGEVSRISNQEFVNAYNRRTETFVKKAASRPSTGRAQISGRD